MSRNTIEHGNKKSKRTGAAEDLILTRHDRYRYKNPGKGNQGAGGSACQDFIQWTAKTDNETP